jgi:hypothetical protein
MNQQSNRPRTYHYRGHRIEPLHSRVSGPDGWLSWLVCPDYNPEGSWYARSLADARESIKAAVQESIEVAELQAWEDEGRALLAQGVA